MLEYEKQKYEGSRPNYLTLNIYIYIVNTAHKGMLKVQGEISHTLTQVRQIVTYISDMEEYNKEFKYNINLEVETLKTNLFMLRDTIVQQQLKQSCKGRETLLIKAWDGVRNLVTFGKVQSDLWDTAIVQLNLTK